MKKTFITKFFLVQFLVSSLALAENHSPGTKVSTDIRFDGTTVGGKIQNPLEAVSVVENEKNIDDLIGVRKNFDDRIQKAKGMR